jgi:tRNA (guanine-N7-)-methyltransferase
VRQKLIRFEEITRRNNIVEPSKALYKEIKGNWHERFFKNQNNITLELACGRGEYTVGLSRVFPDRNYIGVDIKGERMWKGSTIAIEEGLSNAGFLRTRMAALEEFFEPGEVAEIYVVFPDPRPKGRDERRRLTCPRYLDIYQKIIQPNGLIHLKTDNTALFEYTLEVLEERKVKDLEVTWDLYHSPFLEEHHGIKTKYEEKFNGEGHDIKYLRFRI